jgi:hypothetical protein
METEVKHLELMEQRKARDEAEQTDDDHLLHDREAKEPPFRNLVNMFLNILLRDLCILKSITFYWKAHFCVCCPKHSEFEKCTCFVKCIASSLKLNLETIITHV